LRIFISGNGPLVAVSWEALARDDLQRDPQTTKDEAVKRAKAFIQNIRR
jgi:hypothetical protein